MRKEGLICWGKRGNGIRFGGKSFLNKIRWLEEKLE